MATYDSKPFSLSVHFNAPHPPIGMSSKTVLLVIFWYCPSNRSNSCVLHLHLVYTVATSSYVDYYLKNKKSIPVSKSIHDEFRNSAYKMDSPEEKRQARLEKKRNAQKERKANIRERRQKRKESDIADIFSTNNTNTTADDSFSGIYDDQQGYRNLKTKRKQKRIAQNAYSRPDWIKETTAVYWGMIEEIDHWVGELMETLKQCNMDKNTLVVFTADHGEMVSSYISRQNKHQVFHAFRFSLKLSIALTQLGAHGRLGKVCLHACRQDLIGFSSAVPDSLLHLLVLNFFRVYCSRKQSEYR